MAGLFPLPGDEGGAEHMKSDMKTQCRLHKDFGKANTIQFHVKKWVLLHYIKDVFDPRVLLKVLQIQYNIFLHSDAWRF